MSNVTNFDNRQTLSILKKEGIHVVDSRLIAQALDIQHHSFLKTISRNINAIENEFGKVRLEVQPSETGSKQKQKIAYLTEDQALFIATLSRNNPKVIAFKSWLVKSFQALRRQEAQSHPVLTEEEQILKGYELLTKKVKKLEATNEQQHQYIERITPKLQYHDKVLQSSTTYNITQIAKELGMTAIKLNKILHLKGIQYKSSGIWVLYASHQNKGYTETQTHTRELTDGSIQTYMQTRWTEKGRRMIHGLLNGQIAMELLEPAPAILHLITTPLEPEEKALLHSRYDEEIEIYAERIKNINRLSRRVPNLEDEKLIIDYVMKLALLRGQWEDLNEQYHLD